MRSTPTLAAILLFSFSLSSHANIIWDFWVGPARGNIITTGNFEEVVGLNGPGSFGVEILEFKITESTSLNLPTGDVWDYGTGSIGINFDFNQALTFAVDFEASTLLTFPINVLGADLLFQATQNLVLRNYIAMQGDSGIWQNLELCAKDTEFFLNNGIRPYPCSDFSYRAPFGFGITPVGSAGVTSVSEPAPLSLLGLVALVFARRFRLKQS